MRKMVEDFFADRITSEEFRQELTRDNAGLRPKKKPRILPKARGRAYS